MLPEDVKRAVEAINDSESVSPSPNPNCEALVKLVDVGDWLTIRAHLEAREAEIAEWSGRALREQTAHHEAIARAEKTEALLLVVLFGKWCTPEYDAARQRAFDHLQEQEKGA